MLSTHSKIAVLFASLVVMACADVYAGDKSGSHRLTVVRPKPGDEGRRSWVSAIGNDRSEQILALTRQFDLNTLLGFTAPNGKTALMVASKKGHLPLAKALVAGGASVHDLTLTNGTAFMFAVLGDQRELAQWLYEQGADIDVVGSNGWTALTIAAAKGNDALLQWLISLNANAQVRDVYRYTPMLRAAENGNLHSVRLLLDLPDTDINAQDEYDNTALHHAVAAGNVPMIQLLLSKGAKPELANRQGVTAAQMADRNNELAELFVAQQ